MTISGEEVMSDYYLWAREFFDRLDALLLTYGMDLLKYMEEVGVPLHKRDISTLGRHMGSEEYAQTMIGKLPSAQEKPKTDNVDIAPSVVSIPEEFKTERGKEILRLSVKEGLMAMEKGRYVWKSSSALMGFFAVKVSEVLDMRPSNDRIPWKKFQFIDGWTTQGAKDKCSDYKDNETASYPNGWEKIYELLRDTKSDVE